MTPVSYYRRFSGDTSAGGYDANGPANAGWAWYWAYFNRRNWLHIRQFEKTWRLSRAVPW